jgi:hypothetical protein
VNGQETAPTIHKGYAVVSREWERGDRIEFEVPMEPQQVRADERIRADIDLVALRYGPLVYNVENPDNGRIDRKLSDAPLRAEWRPDLLGGIMVIKGEWQDGSPMIAVPNFVRMNRVGPPPEYPSDRDPDRWKRPKPLIESKVWI